MRWLIVVCVACAIAAMVFGLRIERTPSYLQNGTVDFTRAQEYWGQIIRSSGESAARSAFLQQGDALSVAQAHVLAHSFGAALFEADGIRGITWCGTEFLYGCYHQLIGNAIVQMGTSVIPQLYAMCAKSENNGFGCEHGIGHGLVGYFGYTQSDLMHALELCSSLDANPMGGCLDGAFMEYNIRELAALNADGSFKPRPLISDVYSPCDSLPIQYKEACTFELPDWWESVITGQPIVQTFKKIGSHCDDMLDENLRQICDEGEGYVVPPPANTDPAQVKNICGAGDRPERDTAYCIAGVAWRYRFSYDESPATACRSLELSGKELALCIAFTSLPRGATTTVPF